MDHHRGIYLNVDFTSYYLVHGRRKTLKLFEELKYLEYYYYRHLYFFGGEDTIENYLFKVINLTKYQFENKKKQYDITPAKSLFHLPNKSFRYLCPKAKAIIENERVIYNNANVESIYGVLKHNRS